jgi:hypothetical protein
MHFQASLFMSEGAADLIASDASRDKLTMDHWGLFSGP